MTVAEHIYDPGTKKLLMKCGTILNKELIVSLKSHAILEIPIEEEYTLSMNPIELTATELKKSLNEEFIRLVSNKPEANPSEKITNVSKRVINLLNKIKLSDNQDTVEFCLQMKICNSEFLFKHCITSCALSVLIAGCLDLDDHDIITIGQAALLHDVGLCEMPFIIETIKRSSQEEALFEEHSKMVTT
jgi:HD-GYP domain-containing protein (c-di-GMP phosphodiesterase class II)